MVDTIQLRDALEKTGMEPDKAAVLAPELARHLATLGADACTSATRKVHRAKPGPELERPYASVRSWFKHMPYTSLRDYWENMPATAPMLFATLLVVIYASALLVRRAWYY